MYPTIFIEHTYIVARKYHLVWKKFKFKSAEKPGPATPIEFLFGAVNASKRLRSICTSGKFRHADTRHVQTIYLCVEGTPRYPSKYPDKVLDVKNPSHCIVVRADLKVHIDKFKLKFPKMEPPPVFFWNTVVSE